MPYSPATVSALGDKIKQNVFVQQAQQSHSKKGGLPSWLELNAGASAGKMRSWPNRDEISYPVDEQLIVELYSK